MGNLQGEPCAEKVRNMRQRLWCVKLVAFLLCTCVAQASYGARREYKVTLDGARLKGGEVCFFAGESASDPFSLFFSYDQVECLSADEVIDFPAGLFHVFARHSAGYVGAYHEFVVFPPDTKAEAGYDLMEIPLSEAGRVDFSAAVEALQEGQSLGVWIATTPDGGDGFYMPLVTGERSLLVPSGTEVLPIVVADQQPVKIGDPLMLAPRAERPAKFAGPQGGDVVVWIRADPSVGEMDRSALRNPDVSLIVGESTVTPLFPLGRHAPLHALMFFKGVPPGPAQARANGATWRSNSVDIRVQRGEVTVAADPLMIIPAAAIEILPERESDSVSLGSCRETGEAAAVIITLSWCGSPGAEASLCRSVASGRTFWGAEDGLTIGQLTSGWYRVAIDDGLAKPRSYPVELVVGKRSEFRVPLADAFRLYGTVTVDGKPVRARLNFFNGVAFSDDSGRYTAIFPSNPRRNRVLVLPCDGNAVETFVPREEPIANAPFDIRIDFRDVVVTVRDGEDRPLENVGVTFSPLIRLHDKDRPAYTSDPVTTNSDGVAKIRVPEGFPLVFCGEPGDSSIPSGCSSRIPEAELSRPVILTLDLPGFRGRIDGHVGNGAVALVDASGSILDEASLGRDSQGQFAMRKRPRPGDYFVYTSDVRPLFVLPLPSSSGEEIVLTAPPAPIRTFALRAPASGPAGYVGLWVGGHYVPAQALAWHQDSRGLDIRVERGSTLTIREIAETGPIEVAVAPDAPAVTGSEFVDPFTEPQNISQYRYPVTTPVVVLRP
jgi:hypothetical protein